MEPLGYLLATPAIFLTALILGVLGLALSLFNPFSHGVELIRFTLYGKLDWVNLAVVVGCLVLSFGLALWGYQSRSGALKRKFR